MRNLTAAFVTQAKGKSLLKLSVSFRPTNSDVALLYFQFCFFGLESSHVTCQNDKSTDLCELNLTF